MISFFSALSGEGWAECKVRPPCSEKDYFQIHTACDSEGRVSSLGHVLFSFIDPPPSNHLCGFSFVDAGAVSLGGA